MVYSRSAHPCITVIVGCLLSFLGWMLDDFACRNNDSVGWSI